LLPYSQSRSIRGGQLPNCGISACPVYNKKSESKNMALKKSELYSSLWAGCDELRGGMDASVLVLLFVKYISDRYADA
jgi:hypothetical protein